jgi:hypothetical protein
MDHQNQLEQMANAAMSTTTVALKNEKSIFKIG